ncbi:hypothetical protein V6N12_042499 [Hibiscus sabdariffa]|uniref:Uncharacterized protein n=1 Tax=Hibiscus sabdariffa TaxID=183260 RepID=A0ABR2EEY7_9ROSI
MVDHLEVPTRSEHTVKELGRNEPEDGVLANDEELSEGKKRLATKDQKLSKANRRITSMAKEIDELSKAHKQKELALKAAAKTEECKSGRRVVGLEGYGPPLLLGVGKWSEEVGDDPLNPIEDIPRENADGAPTIADVLDAVSKNLPHIILLYNLCGAFHDTLAEMSTIKGRHLLFLDGYMHVNKMSKEMSANEWRHLFACSEVNPKSCEGISALGSILHICTERSHTLVETSVDEWNFSKYSCGNMRQRVGASLALVERHACICFKWSGSIIHFYTKAFRGESYSGFTFLAFATSSDASPSLYQREISVLPFNMRLPARCDVKLSSSGTSHACFLRVFVGLLVRVDSLPLPLSLLPISLRAHP